MAGTTNCCIALAVQLNGEHYTAAVYCQNATTSHHIWGSRAHAQRRVIVVGRSVCKLCLRLRSDSVTVCSHVFSRTVAAVDAKRGYVQRALGTARVWDVVVKEQRVYGGRLKFTLMCKFLVKAESGGYQTWICG